MKNAFVGLATITAIVVTGCGRAELPWDVVRHCATHGAPGYDYDRARRIPYFLDNRRVKRDGQAVSCVYVPHQSVSDEEFRQHVNNALYDSFNTCRSAPQIQICRVYLDPDTNRYLRYRL